VLLVQQRVGIVKRAEVGPGEFLEVQVDIPTQGLEGSYHKVFSLQTDADREDLREIRLVIRADIQQLLSVTPSRLQFGSLAPGQRAKKSFTVQSAFDDLPSKFRSIANSNPALDVRLVDKSPHRLTFEAEVDGNSAGGDSSTAVRLNFDLPDYPTLDVVASWRRTGDLLSLPSRVVVLDGSSQFKLRIYSRSKSPFRILEIDAPPSIGVAYSQADPRPTHEIVVRISADSGSDPSVRESALVIKTDRAEERLIKIPVIIPRPTHPAEADTSSASPPPMR